MVALMRTFVLPQRNNFFKQRNGLTVMVKINDSRCVDGSQIAAILKRIEIIKSNATIENTEKEGKGNELSEVME